MAKGKHVLHQCSHCDRVTKMELIGATEQVPEKAWYRCTRCRHATMINTEDMRRAELDSRKKLERSDASEYRPENTYQVGQAIFHNDWDDLGKIVSKERTSGGGSAIVVSFEKLGERRLLESVVADPDTVE